MLQFVVKMGIMVTKVHKIIKFKQDYKIRDYIELNTKMRAEAKIEPEKDIFKLMKNSLFGKSCEKPIKYLEAKILTDDYEILKAVSKPTCKDVIRYENNTLIEFYKKEIQYDKPIYLGSTVLELSKLHMHKFFYNLLNPSLKDLMLHYMDTDSFVLSFSEVNVDNEHMDLSNLDKPIKTNNKIPGKFNHELGSKIIEEFVVLKPKTYSIKNYGAKEKGIKKNVMESTKNIKSYPLDENMYLFKRDLVNKICERTSSVASQAGWGTKADGPSLINNTTLELLMKLGLDVSKESLEALIWEPSPLINNIKDLTNQEDRKFIETAIRLYNNLPT